MKTEYRVRATALLRRAAGLVMAAVLAVGMMIPAGAMTVKTVNITVAKAQPDVEYNFYRIISVLPVNAPLSEEELASWTPNYYYYLLSSAESMDLTDDIKPNPWIPFFED